MSQHSSGIGRLTVHGARRASAYSVAAGGVARTGATTRTIPLPEHTPTARAAYIAARGRGESVPRALSRARAELVASAVLTWRDADDREDVPAATDAIDAYDVNPRELARVTSDRRLSSLAGEVRDAATGALILHPVVLPDGATARVYVYADDDATPDDELTTGAADYDAWCEGRWCYVGVAAVVTFADGRRGDASLWGVERGDYWPGSDEAQIWHTIPDLIREAASEADGAEPDPENIPEDDRATCGTCDRSWNATTLPTPAGRCPWEHEHDEDDEPPAANLAAWVRGIVDELAEEVIDDPAAGYDEGYSSGVSTVLDRIREVLDAEASR